MVDAAFLGMIFPLIFLILMLKGESRLLMAFFAWGLVAFMVSMTLNNWLAAGFQITFRQLTVTWAPLIEEFLKSLPLLYFLLRSRSTRYSVIYFAMASGIGFSILENFSYLLNLMESVGALAFYMVIRSLTTCLMHGMASAIVGYGISFIRQYRIMVFPLLFGLFTLSVTIHSLFNLYINSEILLVRLIAMVIPFILYILGLMLLEGEGLEDGGTAL